MADPRMNGARPPVPGPVPRPQARPEPDPLDQAQAEIDRALSLKSAADCEDEITARELVQATIEAAKATQAAAVTAERAVRMASRPEIERPDVLPTLPSAREEPSPESKAQSKALRNALITLLTALATAAAAWLSSR